MIRPFCEADLNSLRSMICDTIDFSYSGVYPVRAVQFFKDYHSEKKIVERNETGEVLVIERERSIVATGALVGSEIQGVFVRPDNQGQGYGKTIMTELENRAKAKGFQEILLDISLPSRRFYEKLGYEVLDECSLDVGEGQLLDYWPARKNLI
jgi:N-acetylglutamate synthase-like GNAT family acetyltransferase